MRQVVPAREYLALEMKKGQILRVTDLEGKQVADLVFFNLHDLKDRQRNGNTIAFERTYNLTVGNTILSEDFNDLCTIVTDTVGQNTATPAFCSEQLNFRRYGKRGTRNCRDNLGMALAPWGITKYDLPACFAVFMNYRFFPDGHVEFAEPQSRAGDHIELRADMDILVGISNCPQESNPVCGGQPTPIEIAVFETNTTA
jgi:uncharacterized protein YcgI (DUF1989 family)